MNNLAEKIMNGETIAIVLAMISALGALGAAIGAWLSARATRSAAEAQLFSRFMEEYGTPQMLTALRTLRNWKAKQGDEFEEKYRKALGEADPNVHKVEQARRLVKFYFLKALRLYEAGFVTQRFLKEVAAVDGVNILYDIVEPLEYALNPAYNKSKFERLRKICGRAGTGRLIRPIPATPRSSEPASEEEHT